MKHIYLLLLLLLMAGPLWAQQSDSIGVSLDHRNRPVYSYQGRHIRIGQIETLCGGNQAAVREFRRAKTSKVFSYIFAYAGGYCIGWTLGTSLGGGSPDLGLAAAGAGLVVIAFTLESSTKKNYRNAVNLYNQGLPHSRINQPQLKVGLAPHGFRLRLSF